MPWYMNPNETCRVLNRIASKYNSSQLHDLKTVLDQATQLIWAKQESYYQSRK